MERFVFVAAIVVASIFAIGAIFGGHRDGWGIHFNMNDDEGGYGTAELVELAPAQISAQSYQAGSIRLRHIAARVVVTAEDRPDVSIEIDNPGHTPTPQVSLEAGRLTVDGQLRGRLGECSADGVHLRGYAYVSSAQLPLITIRAPRDLDLSFTGAGIAEIGPTQSLDLNVNGCAQANAGDVAGEANLDLNGSGRIVLAGAQRASVDLNGSGEVRVEAARAGADAEVNGSGDITFATLTGPLSIDNRGSGSLNVGGGAVTHAEVELFGSGRVSLNAPIERLNVSIFGSGDVDAPVTVGELDAEIFGSGDVRVQAVSGSMRQESRGSGSVRVGR
jgi:hypothetical protein